MTCIHDNIDFRSFINYKKSYNTSYETLCVLQRKLYADRRNKVRCASLNNGQLHQEIKAGFQELDNIGDLTQTEDLNNEFSDLTSNCSMSNKCTGHGVLPNRRMLINRRLIIECNINDSVTFENDENYVKQGIEDERKIEEAIQRSI